MQRGSYTEDTGGIPQRMMQRWSCAEEMTVRGGVPVRRVGLDIELLCYSVVKKLNSWMSCM